MEYRVKLFVQFRYITNGKEVGVNTDGDTVKDVLNALEKAHPELIKAARSGGELSPYVNMMITARG